VQFIVEFDIIRVFKIVSRVVYLLVIKLDLYNAVVVFFRVHIETIINKLVLFPYLLGNSNRAF